MFKKSFGGTTSSSKPRSSYQGSKSRFPSSGGPSRSGSSSSRPPFRRGGAPFKKSSGGRKSFGHHIDVSKFINKAVITENIPHFKPEHNFKDFLIEERLKNNIIKKGYVTPTPIQDRAIPHVLKGSDVVGIANTGTGKTAAFLIPLIDKVLKNPNESVLIMVPTRELAQQIEDELRGFAGGLKLCGTVCVGGANIGKQIKDLRFHNHFVIGTPGRLKDLLERKALNLNGFKSLVLDEADRMLDMGFIHDMRFMISKMPSERQTLFFSATLSRDIEKLINDFLREPISISVKTGDTSKSVDQDVVYIRGKDKLQVLHDLLAQPDFGKVLIFGRTKHGVEKLSKDLLARGFKAESIHGDKNQSRRERALQAFKDSKVNILVATDVAARGIDVSDVSHVINFDIPATYEDYVHRIGRTGRAGKKGKALTFV